MHLRWKDAWKNEIFRYQFIITLLLIALLGIVFPTFFDFIEGRKGPVLPDFMFNILPAKNVGNLVFLFEYTTMLLAILSIRKSPARFLLAMQTYVMVTLLRMLSITVFPLMPPHDYIPMQEPIVGLFTKENPIISHDLFFSGHVATNCAILFAVDNKPLKRLLAAFIVIVGILLIVQRNHYTIDIVAAPIITYVCYLISKNLFLKKWQSSLS